MYSELIKKLDQLRLRTARFRRVALHLHSPESKDWATRGGDKDRNDKGKLLADGAEGVFMGELIPHFDLIAITDHMKCGYPHEYIVEEKVDRELYAKLADHIDANGYTEYFYKKPVVYFDYDGYTYWHMENIINRCVVADTYHRRKQNGRLPDGKD